MTHVLFLNFQSLDLPFYLLKYVVSKFLGDLSSIGQGVPLKIRRQM